MLTISVLLLSKLFRVRSSIASTTWIVLIPVLVPDLST